ncbi:MAG TPA: VOC family protein, partial [Gemmatimonadota bacterium]|nr:VOC family protein [Gemmatimonadota bacterium]
MLQTVASMQTDVPAVASPPGGSVLYVEIEDLSAIEKAVADYELLVPRRKTFYGADEIFVREPGGNVVGFAQFSEA